jgi:lysophospholipase L1-like esterase
VFTRYIALGDSVSIDLYPALDAGEIDVAVALERVTSAGRVAPLGAASLLYKNSEQYWPDDIGDDLESMFPGIEAANVATDGATIGEVFGEQLTQIEETGDRVLITLTVGGNDLLSAFGNRQRRDILEKIADDVAEAYDFLVDFIRGRFPGAIIILTTVYDPSDGTGRIPGVHDGGPALPLDVLDQLNNHIRTLAGGTPNILLADAHRHFLGHGITAAETDRWYWKRSLIEPNARGASEIRHLWLDALRNAGETPT